MTVVDFTFPQNGDADFAENFGTWLGRSSITDYVEEGLSVTISSPSAPEVSITNGKAFLSQPEKTISSNSETRLTLDYCIIKQSETLTTSLTDGDVNYIYLNGSFDSNDAAQYNVYTDQSNALPNSLLIATVDLVNNTVVENNRLPDIDVDVGSFSQVLNIPIYPDTTDASSGEGNVVFIDGSTTQPQGLYIYTSGSWIRVGLDLVQDLDNVSVTGFDYGTDTSKPSAGTNGRIYFNTTFNHVEYDNGSSWVELSNAESLKGPDGDEHYAGSLPEFTNTTDGINATESGDLFYNTGDGETYLHDAADNAAIISDLNAIKFKGNDIDSNGDGTVDSADIAESFETRSTDPTSPAIGRIWYRSDLD